VPPKLRPLVHVLLVIVGAFALLWLGLIWLPALFTVLWIMFVIVVAAGALLLLFRRPASRAKANANTHRLTRSRDQWIMGVCGGIAEFLGWQPGVVRGLWLLFSLLFVGIGGVLIYTILAFVMPSPPTRGGKFRLEDFRVQ
jgi:phage shock protein C